MTAEKMRAWVNEKSDEWKTKGDKESALVVMDGYDDCIVGIVWHFNRAFVLYDRQKVIAKLMKDGMTEEEAWEFHEYNQAGAWVGDHTPAFLDTPPTDWSE